MNKCIEITATKHYAKIEGGVFKVGHITGGERKYGNPFVEFPCKETEDPIRLYQIWAKGLEKPKRTVLEGYYALGDTIRYVPVCPTCTEVTYGQSSCPFCGQVFEGEDHVSI